jgi:starch phosphorylase
MLARQINDDVTLQDKLKVVFVENYNVSKAQLLIPATDISLQISTAGLEASGTGNMKFALNGAITVGTLDGANVEMLEEIGADNIIIFGRRAEEIAAMKQGKGKNGHKSSGIYDKNPVIKRCLDEMLNGGLLAQPDNTAEHELLTHLARRLLTNDQYFILEDFAAFQEAMQKAFSWHQEPLVWARRMLLNIARMGKFSSDRSIAEYARDIWHLQPIDPR